MTEGTTPTPQDAGKPRLLAGKYTTAEALEKGYTEQRNETQRIIAERNRLEEQNRMLQATLAGFQNQGENEPEDDGGMSDARVVSLIQQVLNPLFSSAEAVATFGSDQPAISEYLRSNPEVQATFQSMVGGNPHGAAEYVKLKYADALREVSEAEAERVNDETRATREQARNSAAIPSGRADSRAPAAAADADLEAHAARYDQAVQYGRQSGDYGPLARMRLLEGPGAIEIWGPGEPPPPSMMGKK